MAAGHATILGRSSTQPPERLLAALQAAGQWFELLVDAYEEGVPESWRALRGGQLEDLLELVEVTGWCLTIAPHPHTLAELLKASEQQAREEILLSAEAEIVELLDDELRQLPPAIFADVHRSAREALEAYTAGLYRPSQALSAVAVGALLTVDGPFGERRLKNARERLEKMALADVGIREFRYFAVSRALAASLAQYTPGGPPPTVFNRHACAHTVSARQYGQLNALAGVLLLCGALHEAVRLAEHPHEAD